MYEGRCFANVLLLEKEAVNTTVVVKEGSSVLSFGDSCPTSVLLIEEEEVSTLIMGVRYVLLLVKHDPTCVLLIRQV